ncbi:MAG: GDP-L-fucose synthase, partial [Gammaproteobacteria bacterium]
HADDCADALIHVLAHYESPEPINIGTGVDHTIAELLATIVAAVGFEGRIVHDTSKPDGPARRLLDSSRLASLGWRSSVTLEAGIRGTYRWYVEALRTGHIRT